jgi:ABC-type multidrug transport system ATPase subunit
MASGSEQLMKQRLKSERQYLHRENTKNFKVNRDYLMTFQFLNGENITIDPKCSQPGLYVNLTYHNNSKIVITKIPTCDPCPIGYYCPNMYKKYLCPGGYFCNTPGIQLPSVCGDNLDFTYLFSQEQCKSTAPYGNYMGNTTRPYSIEGLVRIIILIMCTIIMLAIIKVINEVLGRIFREKITQRQIKRIKRRFSMISETMNNETNEKEQEIKTFPIRPGITFTYENLSLKVYAGGKEKVIVDRVSGQVPAATMTAVMGPSGAGKTSFMNVLCDRAGYGVTSGKLTLNGTLDRISNHRDIMGFVPQDDVVHDDLTVRENLSYAAMLRLPIPNNNSCRTKSIFCSQRTRCCNSNGGNREYYDQYVDRVLEMLQMGHIQHSIVGSVEKRGISGGQKKRVNIGLELVADPDVLFLDEPTSGLDSTSSEIILAALKELSRLGRTIIMVIHQPRYSIFASMDNVIFLGPGGKTVYSGSPIDATDYFEMLGFYAPQGVNHADFFMDVIGGTINRSNFPDFHPKQLFSLWLEWVKFSKR